VDDPGIYLLILLIVGFIFIAPIVALVRAGRAAKNSAAVQTELGALREQIRVLTTRLFALERSIANPPSAGLESPAPPPSSAPEPVAPKPIQVVSTPLPPSPSAPPVSAPPLSPARPAAPPPPQQPPPQQPPRPAPFATALTPSLTKPAPERNWSDIEERLGANWLNKIGTAAFVIGVALLLNYSMHYLGPAGKIALGYFLSVVLLVLGIIGERNERYRVAGRAVLGGGWALAYFTTYALHNVAAVKLVDSPAIGFTLLFIVAAAMVVHSLKYHSEITTGFAYLLAFASIAISEIPLGALFAAALLAVSLIVVLRQRKWYAIEPLAVIATYSVHWLWLDQTYQRLGGYRLFPEFTQSAVLLSIYWLIYLLSHFLRDDSEPQHQQLLSASFLLNAAGYLAVMHHQSFHPELRFWFLMSVGIIYLGVSAYSRTIHRRLAFILSSTLGAALVVAAVPYRYSDNRLKILWLVEAEAFLITGWRILDKHLRRLGWAASGVLAGYVIAHDLTNRLANWAPPNWNLGWLLLALAAAFYTNAKFPSFISRGAASGDDIDELDQFCGDASPGFATIFLLSASWIALPLLWTALVWSFTAAALVLVGRHFRDRILYICGHFSALLAVLRLLGLNLYRDDSWHSIHIRIITISISAALFYVIARRTSLLDATENDPNTAGAFFSDFLARIGGFPALYTGAASLLVTLLLWQDLTTAAISLAWGLFGLVLLEASRAFHDRPLLIQSRILIFLSFARIFIADFNSVSRIGSFAAPVVTVSLLAAIYFYDALTSPEPSRMRSVMLWLGTISIAALLRFEVRVEWVAVTWALLAIALYFAGARRDLRALRDQSFVMTFLVGIRCAFDNFYQLVPWHFTNTRTVTVVAASVLLYVLFAVTQSTRQSRLRPSSSEPPQSVLSVFARFHNAWNLLRKYPQHLFFFVPTILVTVLLSLEVRRGYLTPAWGLEGLIIFLIVLKMDERAYRWFSLLLFFLCVGRILTVDIWNLDALGRIVSFMGLGLALLAVSFLYARHREVFRRVL